jgi:methionyl-tRNA formyltransferase
VKIAILTSLNQWFVPYAIKLKEEIDNSELFFSHKEIDQTYSIVFILGYHKIIEKQYLDLHQHNIVVHESALPLGKGWAPMFWQVLEEKSSIPFTMFEAGLGIDDGDIYMQKDLVLTGYELNNELREKQAKHTINMCLDFLTNYDNHKVAKKQKGKETFYKKRTSKDSELNINKSIKEQFNLLRIVDNKNYPAFFLINDKKYKIKIEEIKE